MTVTPGITDLTSYSQARTPTASVVLTAAGAVASLSGVSSKIPPNAGAAQASTASAAPTTLVQPTASGGVFSEVNLGPLPTSALPPLASVTLQFDASNAGTVVWVQTLDGGTLQALQPDGQTVTAATGLWMELNSAGQLSFTFQAPAQSFRYQVFVRMDNVSTILPFVVSPVVQAN